MFKILPLLLIAAVLAVKAYDFSVPDYNQNLLDEFYSLNKDVSFSRQRRHAKYDSVEEEDNAPMCCEGYRLDAKKLKKVKKIKRQCALQIAANFSDNENFDTIDGKFKQFMVCQTECFGRATNVIDESGKLNLENIITDIEDNAHENSWIKSVYRGYLEDCLDKIESERKENDQQCSSTAYDFSICAFEKFETGCPADLRIDSPTCNIKRLFFSNANGTSLS